MSVVVAVEAAADGGGELVGVADAVFANEAVAREEPVPGEAAFVGVKVGDFALVFVGGVEVVQARLQRLCPVFALPAEVALEGEFAVKAEGRQEAVVVFAAQLVLARAVVVMGVVGADLRLDVAVGGLKTVSGADVAAVAVGSAQFVLVEVDGFGIDVVAPVAVFEGVVVGELRRAAVGFVRFADHRVNALVVLRAQHEVAVVRVAVEGEMALQIPFVVEAEVGGEVLDVVHVGDLLVQQVGVPLVVEVVLVGAAPAPARVVRAFAVVGEQSAVKRAFLFFAKEAVFGVGHQTAFGHRAEGEGGILVGGDVPVVGDADFKTALFAAAHRRNEEAALPRRADGEGEVGQVEHRDFADAQRHVARNAAFAVVVEHQRMRLDVPGGMEAGAGRPGDAFKVVAVVFAVKARVFR